VSQSLSAGVRPGLPSRFNTTRYVGMPSLAARRMYLQTKEPSLSGEELAHWAHHTEGFSLAHLRELIIAVRCFGQSFEAALERIESIREAKPSSQNSPQKSRTGFLNGATAARH
jgi:hypothetical protein